MKKGEWIMWLNVDFDPREYACRLHRDDCWVVRRRQLSPAEHKGFGHLGRDGGWLYFDTAKAAKAWHQANYPEIPWKPCKFCTV